MTASHISRPIFPDMRQRLQAAESLDAGVGATGEDGVQSAWLREMEREQMQGWLNNPVTVRTGPDHPALNDTAADATARRLDIKQFQQTGGLPGSSHRPIPDRMPEALNNYRSNSFGLFDAGIGASSVTENERPVITQRLTELVERRSMRSKALVDNAEIEQRLDESNEAEVKPSNPASTSEDVDAASTPRISVQWFGNDIKIWIGVGKRDGLSSDDFEHLLQESKSLLASEGCQLLSLTCNGEVIYNNSTNRES